MRMNRETTIEPLRHADRGRPLQRRRNVIIAARGRSSPALVGAYLPVRAAATTQPPARPRRRRAAASRRPDPDGDRDRPGPQRGRAHRHRVGRARRAPRPAGRRRRRRRPRVRRSMSMPAAGSARARCWPRIDRSVQAQEAAQLAAQIQVARADAALAQNELERSQSLVGRGFVSKADLDRKRAARDAANARVRVAQAQLGATQARIGRLDIRAPDRGPDPVAQRRSRPDRQRRRGRAVPPRARRRDGNARPAVAAGPGAASAPACRPRSRRSARPQLRRPVWQISPVIDPQSRQGEVRIAIPYDPVDPPRRLRRGADRRRLRPPRRCCRKARC